MKGIVRALLSLFMLIIGTGQAAASSIDMTLGQLYEISLDSSLEDLMIGDESRLLVEWREDALLLFAVGLGTTHLRWKTEDAAANQLTVHVRPEHRDVLLRFLELYRSDDNVLLVESSDQVWLQGEVNYEDWQRYQQLSEVFPDLNMGQLRVRTPAPEMIELEVNVVEIRRRFLRSQGLSWSPSASGPALGLLSDWLGGGSFRLFNDLTAGWQPTAEQLAENLSPGTRGYLGWQTSLSSTLRLLEERGEASLLASPKLRVLSGQSTDFLAGGELPLPQVNADGQMQVAFHPYGIRVVARPERLPDGQIQAWIEAEVSSLDAAVAVQGIPGLLTRKSTSTVQIAPGETLVLSGLRSRESQLQQSGLPTMTGVQSWFARNLGGLTERGHQETEMMVFITPRVLQEEQEKSRIREQRREVLQGQLASATCRGMSYQVY